MKFGSSRVQRSAFGRKPSVWGKRRPLLRGSGFNFVHSALVLALCWFCLQSFPGFAQQNVLTYHNDNQRTGQNLNESILTPANVNQSQFGQFFSYNVDGWIVGQPLYMQNVTITNQGNNLGAHNVIYVATLHDSVYAFDADSGSANGGAPLWQVSFINPASGITTVPATEAGCQNVTKFTEQGVIGTPVIDPTTNTMYLVAKTKENGAYFQRLHAISINDGSEKFGGPVTISASLPGTGDGGSTINFNALNEMSRTGVVLDHNTVYLTFSANGCKQVANHGWTLAYDASTLAQIAAFSTTPNTNNGGTWQSGSGPAVDGAGNIYFETADADFDMNAGGGDYGDSIMKLSLGDSFVVSSSFTPMAQDSLNNADLDLASVGPLILPDGLGPLAHPNLVIGSGKDETIYVMDRDNLGGYNSLVDQLVQEVSPFSSKQRYGVPTYWNGKLYFQQLNQVTIAYSITNGVLSSSPVDQTTVAWARPNPMSISALGNTNGILWSVTSTPSSATLRAYDPTFLATEFYDSDQAGSRDTLGPTAHFATPTIANGRVYVGAQTRLVSFGLLGVAPSVGLSPASLTFSSQALNTTSAPQSITLTNTGTAPLSVNSVSSSGDFAQTNTCTTNVAAGSACTITVTFTPTASGTRTGTITIVDNAGDNPQSVSLTGTGTQTVSSTTVTLSSGQNPSTFGQSVSFTAAVSSSSGIPTGTVTFSDGGNTLGTGLLDGTAHATFSTASLSAGSHTISAAYSGDSSDSPSASSPLTQTVNQTASTTSLASSSNPSVVNQPVTFTATISPQFGGTATGTVTFNDGANVLGTAAVTGNVATFTIGSLSKGTHSITAVYGGDTNVAGSSASALSQLVNPAPTTTAVTSSVNPSFANQATTFTATVTGQFGGTPTGTITLKSGTLSLGTITLSGGAASLNKTFTTSGTRSITAVYSSDANFTGSTSPVLSQVVNAAPTSTAVTSNLNPSNYGDAVTFTATVTSAFGTPTGSVTFKAGNTTLGTANLSGGSASLTTSALNTGTKSITATYKATANFAASTSPVYSQVVNRLNTTTALASSQNPSVAGQAVTFTATVTTSFGTPTGSVTFKDGSTIIGTVALNGGTASLTTSSLSAGSHTIKATLVQNGNYNGSTGSVVQQVN